MKEIEEAFNELWEWHSTFEYEFAHELCKTQKLVKETIQNLRKENFALYKALHGVKHPEDV